MNKNLFGIITVFIFSICTLSCVDKAGNVKSESLDANLYPILVGDKYGYMDCNGRIVIEPQFDVGFKMSEGLAYAVSGDRKGLIDSTGNYVLDFPDSVTSIGNLISGLIEFKCGYAKWGIMDLTGKVIIPATHKKVSIFVDEGKEYIRVDDWNTTCIINRFGDTIGSVYDSIWGCFSQGMCGVKMNEKWGYIDTTGRLVIDTIYDWVRVFSSDGIARVGKDGRHIFMDRTGKHLFSVDSSMTGFVCNRAAVVINGEKYLVNKRGDRVCKVDYDRIYPFNEEDFLATVKKDSKTMKIDTMGNVVVKTEYDYIGAFIEGVAPVIKSYKLGFIDTTGNEIIKLDFNAYNTHDSTHHIRTLQSFGSREEWIVSYYDLKGNLIWKDIPRKKKELPIYSTNKKDYEAYYDDRIAELDPIEGIYYVNYRNYYQDRDKSNNIGLNSSSADFYAVYSIEDNEFKAIAIDGSGWWVNKFVRLGETNDYAIVKVDKDNTYSSEGRVTIDDPTKFDFRLEQGHNSWYNFFVTYEFVKDYPPASAYEQYQNPEWEGSGFAIADGYIATNYHVAHGAKSIRVRGIDGNMDKSYKAFVVASDKEHDISILKVVDKEFDGFGTLPYTLGKAMVEVGDEIFVLGYPLSTTMGNEVKLTNGIISSSTGYKGNDAMYQISAAVQPGNSGGPLFNADGAIIGIVCAKHADAENANYAMKISYLYSLVNSSNLGINISEGSLQKDKKLSKKVNKLKKFVYKIECSSR